MIRKYLPYSLRRCHWFCGKYSSTLPAWQVLAIGPFPTPPLLGTLGCLGRGGDCVPGIEFYVKAFIALFVLVNPLEGIPVFLAGTRAAEPGLRRAIARRASVAVTVIVMLSALLGNGILQAFGVSVAAFQIGGGVILFMIGVKMVFGDISAAFGKTPEGGVTLSFAIVPLAIPLMAGPGAITGAILYGTRVHHAAGVGILAGVIALVGLATFASLRAAGWLARYLKDAGITIAASIMGLIIAAIAFEMMGHGVGGMFGWKVFGGAP